MTAGSGAGRFGRSGWTPDWPPDADQPLPNHGLRPVLRQLPRLGARQPDLRQRCRTSRASPGEPLVFLSQQHFFDRRHGAEPPSRRRAAHRRRAAARPAALSAATIAVIAALRGPRPRMPELGDGRAACPRRPTTTSGSSAGGRDRGGPVRDLVAVPRLPRRRQHRPAVRHDARPTRMATTCSTSRPTRTWRTSPMGLGGRDPIFFAQLASETADLPPRGRDTVQDICLGCHGVVGAAAVRRSTTQAKTGECPPFLREVTSSAVPWPADNPSAALPTTARWRATASPAPPATACCPATSRENAAAGAPENRCVKERQALLNPDNRASRRPSPAASCVGPPDELYRAVRQAQDQADGGGARHQAASTRRRSRAPRCAARCHTVHLPVLPKSGKVVAHVYEQTTYPEWAFSAYRTGADAATGQLPSGAGRQGAVLPGLPHAQPRTPTARPYRSKIASIQERSNYPAGGERLGPARHRPRRCAKASRATRSSGSTSSWSRWRSSFPTCSASARRTRCSSSAASIRCSSTEQAMLDQASRRPRRSP